MMAHVRNLLRMQWLVQKITSISQGYFEHFYSPLAGQQWFLKLFKDKNFITGATLKDDSIYGDALHLEKTKRRIKIGGVNGGTTALSLCPHLCGRYGLNADLHLENLAALLKSVRTAGPQ